MIHSNCKDCQIALNDKNRYNNDPLAAFCSECWGKRKPWSPTCGKCKTPLQQDPENLSHIFCPNQCSTMKLEPANQAASMVIERNKFGLS